jgi:mono/diheme cytochrome c family protein
MNFKYSPVFLSVLVTCLMLGCTGEPPPVEEPGEQETVSVTQTEPVVIPDPTEDLELGNPEIGREYFYGENRGRCLTCHTLNGEGFEGGWALDDAGLRHDAEYLARFLDNPRNIRPEVAVMPPYRGDSEGATIADVVQFLLTLQTPVERAGPADIKPEDEPEPNHDGIAGSTGSAHGGSY